MKRTLIIMAKVPVPGKVKTRLGSVLDPDQSSGLAACLLRDTISKVGRVDCRSVIAFWPAEKAEYFDDPAFDGLSFVPQEGADLGERMLNAFKFGFGRGAEEVLMIGTDSPTFPADFIEQAFEFLETNSDAVLGKTEDGGFYLIGLRQPDERIFEGVNWSSPETFEQVRRNIMDLDLHLREVPSWYDIDEPDDLERLYHELHHSRNAKNRAPQTFEWMQANYIPR